MSLWAILAAPLLAGNDLSKMDETTKSILMNKEVIAVDQDSLGRQGYRLGPLQVWVRSSPDGAKALAIFNFVTDDVPQPVTVSFKDLGFTGPVHARDLWAHKDLGSLSRFVYRDAAQRRRGDAAVVAVRRGGVPSHPNELGWGTRCDEGGVFLSFRRLASLRDLASWQVGGAGWEGLLSAGRGNDAELLHHAQGVHEDAAVGHAAIGQTVDHDAFYGDTLVRSRGCPETGRDGCRSR